MTATSAVPLSDSTGASTITRITNPRRLLLLRTIWLILTVFIYADFFRNLPAFYTAYINGTTGGNPIGGTETFSTPDWFISASFLQVVIAIVAPTLILTGVFLLRSDNWMVALASITLGLFHTHSSPTAMFLGGLFPIAFGFLFPDGRFVPRWTRWAAGLNIVVIGGLVFTNPSRLEIGLITAVFAMIAIFAQVQRYRYFATAEQRQQTKIYLVGLIVTIGVLLSVLLFVFILPRMLENSPLLFVLGLVTRLLVTITVIAFAVTYALAVLRYGLYQADFVLNRSLVYAVISLALIIVFGVIIVAAYSIVGPNYSGIAFAAGAVGVGVLFNPARKNVQQLIDRRFFRLNFNLNELHAAHRKFQIANPGALSGKSLSGYEVRDVIGQGGMGEVYQGFGNGQTVAIKTMLPKIAQDADMRTRFQREAQAGMQLDHPHIAKVYAHGEMDGTPYLVMDYIEGQDLSQMLKTGGKLDEETTRRMMQDICAALDAAHGKGFIHRDLKPSNIMIRPNGEAVLMDFGVTKMTDASTSLTGTGAIGTIDYMAPEQIAAAREVDKRADIYALGVMLYELMTGEKPFKGSAAQILFAHLQQPPPDARDINPTIPANIADAIERAMSKKPEERFQSTGELAAALHE